MKKLSIGLVALAMSTSVMAADIGIASVYDKETSKYGTRVSVSPGTIFGLAPTVTATNFTDSYVRYGVGLNTNLIKVGGVTVGAGVAGIYQNTVRGENGYGGSVNVNAAVNLTKNAALVGGVEYTKTETKLNQDGTSAFVGVRIGF